MDSKIYFITGANRGIGRGLVTALLARPSTTVIATVRDPGHETAKSLKTLATAAQSRVIVLKLDQSKDGDDAVSATIQKLQREYPDVTHVDVAIANAGTQTFWGPVSKTPLSETRSHLEVNLIAPLALFQALLPLLEKSMAEAGPKFVAITSPISSIGDMEHMPFPCTPYGVSKVALNWMTRKIHVENPNLIAFPISPGWVQTDMGNDAANQLGQETAPVSLDASIRGVLNQIDTATREKSSGNFMAFDGKQFNW